MRRLVLLTSYDKIMLKINAVIMLQKRGEPAMNSITIGMDLGDKKHVVCALMNRDKDRDRDGSQFQGSNQCIL